MGKESTGGENGVHYDKAEEKNSQMVWELAGFICFKHNVQSELPLAWLAQYWQSKTVEGLQSFPSCCFQKQYGIKCRRYWKPQTLGLLSVLLAA